jgi:hypothetical protein
VSTNRGTKDTLRLTRSLCLGETKMKLMALSCAGVPGLISFCLNLIDNSALISPDR